MTFTFKSLLALGAGLVLGVSAFAQSLPDNFRDRLDPERERSRPAQPGIDTGIEAGTTDIDVNARPGVQISELKFEGIAVPAMVGKAGEPFIGSPLTTTTLKSLVTALSSAYRKSAVALFTLVIPEQDFDNGVVRILAAEGFVESVTVKGDITKNERAFILAHANRISENRPALRKTLDRNLLLLEDTPGLEIEEQILSGTQPAGVQLALDAEQKRTDFSVGYDSRTTRLIDQGQFSGKAAGYGLFRAGDETRLDLASSTNFEDFRYAGLQHGTPLNSKGTRATIGAAWLQSFADDTGISGEATLYSASLSHPFIRSTKQNLRGGLTVDALNSDNAVFGSLIATERTRAARASLSYDHSTDERYVGVSAKVSRGFDVLDARISDPVGELEFTKIEAAAKLVQRLNRRTFLRLSAASQWTDDPLPANERFSVGGPNFGRAFENGLVNADRGASTLIETAYRPIKNGKLSKSELYTFVDYAYTDFAGREIDPIELGSFGGGVRASYKDIGQLELEASKPYKQPLPGYGSDWQFAVSWSIKIDP